MCPSSNEYELDLPVGRSCEAEPEGSDELFELEAERSTRVVQTWIHSLNSEYFIMFAFILFTLKWSFNWEVDQFWFCKATQNTDTSKHVQEKRCLSLLWLQCTESIHIEMTASLLHVCFLNRTQKKERKICSVYILIARVQGRIKTYHGGGKKGDGLRCEGGRGAGRQKKYSWLTNITTKSFNKHNNNFLNTT